MTSLIVKIDGQVGVAVDEIGSGSSPCRRTDLFLGRSVAVAGSLRDESRAGYGAVVELDWRQDGDLYRRLGALHLIDHKRLKRVSHRVQIVEPSEPGVHILGGDGEAGVDDEG